MIQRIQTIYLLLATICVALMYVFPFAKFDVVNQYYLFDHNGIIADGKNLSDIPYHIIIGVLALFTLGTIFLYKKRKVQMQMGRLNYVLHLAIVVAMFFEVDRAKDHFGLAAKESYGIGFYLPVAAIAFLFLANRAIKRDENLIRSLDRLR